MSILIIITNQLTMYFSLFFPFLKNPKGADSDDSNVNGGRKYSKVTL